MKSRIDASAQQSGTSGPTAAYVPTTESYRSLSKWVAVPLGTVGGGLFTSLAAFLLAIVVLMPPISYLLKPGMFDSLALIGLPIYSLPIGTIAGFVLGCFWRLRRSYWMGLSVAIVLAIGFFLASVLIDDPYRNQQHQLTMAIVWAICMVFASAIALTFLDWLFHFVERRRN